MADEKRYAVIRSFRNTDGKTYILGSTVKLARDRAVELRSRHVIGGVVAETPEEKAKAPETPETKVEIPETPEAEVAVPETPEAAAAPPEVKAETPETSETKAEAPTATAAPPEAKASGNIGGRKK